MLAGLICGLEGEMAGYEYTPAEAILKYQKEIRRLKDELQMYESWMKRKGSAHVHGGSVWDAICREYPYLKESDK